MESKEALAQIKELLPKLNKEDFNSLKMDMEYAIYFKFPPHNDKPNISTESLNDAPDK